MLSMCGLLCSMLRGWRHEQAVVLMARALAKTQSSLLIEDLSTDQDSEGSDEAKAGGTSPFCVMGGESRLSQLLWRDNNKQAVIVAPKQCVNLQRWTLFLSAENSTQTGCYPTSNSEGASENGATATEELVTVLLEASYRERDEEIGSDFHVMVEHLSRPYAWKARDVFGVIVTTTPPQLLAMIQAFFNNALLIDDDFLVKKILTIETVGEPATLEDPLSIPESVTPGPWSSDRTPLTQLELARNASPLPQGPGRGIWSGQEGWRGNWLRPPSRLVPLWHQWSGESATSTSTTVQPQSSTDSERHQSSLDPQSSYDSVSDYPTSDADDPPCQVSGLYPRGWAVSGTRVVSGQPLSVRGALARGALTQPYKCSIVTNPLEELWQGENQGRQRDESCVSKQSVVCSNGPSSDHQQIRSNTLPRVKRGCRHPQFCLPSVALCKSIEQAPIVRRERDIVREAAEYYQRAINTAQEHREWIKKSTSSASEEEDFSFSSERTDVVVTHEPRKYPVRIKSEADLSRATNIIRDNLTNIVQNYLIKSGTSPSPESQPLYPKLVREHPTIKVLGVAGEGGTDVQLLGNSSDPCSSTPKLRGDNMPVLEENKGNLGKGEAFVKVTDDSSIQKPSQSVDSNVTVGPTVRSSGRNEKKLTKGEEIVLPPITRDSPIDLEEEECPTLSPGVMLRYGGTSDHGHTFALKEEGKIDDEQSDSETLHVTPVEGSPVPKDIEALQIQEAEQQTRISVIDESKSKVVQMKEKTSPKETSGASASPYERHEAKIPHSDVTIHVMTKESPEVTAPEPAHVVSLLQESTKSEAATEGRSSNIKMKEYNYQKEDDSSTECLEKAAESVMKEISPIDVRIEVNGVERVSGDEKSDDSEVAVNQTSTNGTESTNLDDTSDNGDLIGNVVVSDVNKKRLTTTVGEALMDHTVDIPVIINGTQGGESKVWEGLSDDQSTTSVSWPGENEDLSPVGDDGESGHKSKYLKDIHKLNTKSSTASESSFESLPYRMLSSQPESLSEDVAIELTRPPPENERLRAARLELIRQERIHAISLMVSAYAESEDRGKLQTPEDEKKELEPSLYATDSTNTITVSTTGSLQEKVESTEAVEEGTPPTFWHTTFTSHQQDDSDRRLEASGTDSEGGGGQQVWGSPVLDSGVELLEQETGHGSPAAAQSKSLASPVESVPESGFSSLQEVSAQEGVGDGVRSGTRGPGLCPSKSKDSLDLTETDRLLGTDTLSDDMETLSSSVGDVTLVESGPVSQEGSSRGSISDPFHHDSVPLKCGPVNLVQLAFSTKDSVLSQQDVCVEKETQQAPAVVSDANCKSQYEQRTRQFSDSDSISEMKISESLSSDDTIATRRSLDEEASGICSVEALAGTTSERPETNTELSILINSKALHNSIADKLRLLSESEVMSEASKCHHEIPSKKVVCITSMCETDRKSVGQAAAEETVGRKSVSKPAEEESSVACRLDSKEYERRIPNGTARCRREGVRSEQSERSSPSRHSSRSGVSDLEDEVFLPPPTDGTTSREGASIPKMAASMFVPSTQSVRQSVRGSQGGGRGSQDGGTVSKEGVKCLAEWEKEKDERLRFIEKIGDEFEPEGSVKSSREDIRKYSQKSEDKSHEREGMSIGEQDLMVSQVKKHETGRERAEKSVGEQEPEDGKKSEDKGSQEKEQKDSREKRYKDSTETERRDSKERERRDSKEKIYRDGKEKERRHSKEKERRDSVEKEHKEKECRGSRETERKDSKQKEPRERRDSKEKELRERRDSKEKELRERRDSKEIECKDSKERKHKERRDSKEKEHKERRDSKERELKEHRDGKAKEHKECRDSKEIECKDGKERKHKGRRDSKEKEYRERRDSKDIEHGERRDSKEKEHRERRDSREIERKERKHKDRRDSREKEFIDYMDEELKGRRDDRAQERRDSKEKECKGSTEKERKDSLEKERKDSLEKEPKDSLEKELLESQVRLRERYNQEERLRSSQVPSMEKERQDSASAPEITGKDTLERQEFIHGSQEGALKEKQEEEEGLKGKTAEEELRNKTEKGLSGSQEVRQEEGIKASQEYEREVEKVGTVYQEKEVTRGTLEQVKDSESEVNVSLKRERLHRKSKKQHSQESDKGVGSSEEGNVDQEGIISSEERKEVQPDAKPRLLRMAKLERVATGLHSEDLRTKQWVEKGVAGEWSQHQQSPSQSHTSQQQHHYPHHSVTSAHPVSPELRKCGSEELSVLTLTSTGSSTSKSYLDTDLSSVGSPLCVSGSLEYLEALNGRQRMRSNTNPAISAAKSEDLGARWEKVSIKSQGSLDKFPHFDQVSGQPKPRGTRRKIMSVEAQPTQSLDSSKEMQRSVTLPATALPTTVVTPLSRKEDKKKDKDEKSVKKKKKEKEKDPGSSGERKSAMLSLKGLLKRSKAKEKEKDKESSSQEKLSSPSLFRKLERKSKSGSHSPTPANASGTVKQGWREAAASNPNLQRCGSPLVRGLPHSSSFTSSPFRRPQSASAVFSPAKRGFTTSTGGPPAIENSNGNAGGGGGATLMKVEEEEGPSRRNLDSVTEKPPNVLVYAANKTEYFSAVQDTLSQCLNADRYIVYHLTDELAFKSPWCGSTTLLVVCGEVPAHISTAFIRYLLQGGRILSICSDFLNMAIPLFGTVEVQEQAVVSVSYKEWSSIQLLHHQHCFHSSPRHKRFSQDVDSAKSEGSRSGAVSVEPTHVEIIDEYGGRHRLDLRVLATDDTWAAPTLLAAEVHGSIGSAIFSQVHLERDPRECYSSPAPSTKIDHGTMKPSPSTTEKLSTCNQARLEMLRDLLASELGLDTSTSATASSLYTPAYFLGRHELKESLLNQLRPHMIGEELKRPEITVQFVEPSCTPKEASEQHLPILTSACPLTFSTVKYFENLQTSAIGRLVIYSDLMTSSQKITAGHPPLVHGIVVLPTQQTQGKGRGGNAWVSPLGCAMFSMQLHLQLSSLLGQHLSFLQHLVTLAVVKAVRDLPTYAHIPLSVKWPNDIYLGHEVKIGGTLVEVTTLGSQVIANIGCGVNLSNSNPTVCINDAVRQHNLDHNTSLPELDRETFLARVFNALEDLIDTFQSVGPGAVKPVYYKYWLHSNATVTVQSEQRHTETAIIVGVDDYGFLQAQLMSGGVISLQPDGNTFNMMEGLVYAKTS